MLWRRSNPYESHSLCFVMTKGVNTIKFSSQSNLTRLGDTGIFDLLPLFLLEKPNILCCNLIIKIVSLMIFQLSYNDWWCQSAALRKSISSDVHICKVITSSDILGACSKYYFPQDWTRAEGFKISLSHWDCHCRLRKHITDALLFKKKQKIFHCALDDERNIGWCVEWENFYRTVEGWRKF